MDFYFAPMEGITGYIQRNAFASCFSGIDKYFTAFIASNQQGKFSSREKNDIMPEHNIGIRLIPQIMTNNAEDFLKTSESLKIYGYKEVNLNLGCPSKTVVSKGRGSGFLAKPDDLNDFLRQIFEETDMEISVKTRIGLTEPQEMYRLLDIYNRYPLKELIVHPRTQTDYYHNSPDLEMFRYVYNNSKAPLCYNGDIVTADDFHRFKKQFPKTDRIMIGRGLLRNPCLITYLNTDIKPDKESIRLYHDKIYEGYKEVLFGDKHVLFKMKELWHYLSSIFEDSKKYEKKIKKAERLAVYEEVTASLFSDLEIAYDKV